METLSFFIILFVGTLAMCVAMLVLLRRERRARAAGQTEAVRSITRLRMRLTVGFIIGVVALFLIYYFALGWGKTASGHDGGLSYFSLSQILFWECIAAQLVLFGCAYRGKMNASSRFADRTYLKRFARKLMWITLAVFALTALIYLLLKYN